MRQASGAVGVIGGTALLVGLFAICCGGPLVLAALAATGLGAWLLASGGPALAAVALLAATALGGLWLRRRGWRLARTTDADCCAPAEPVRSEVAR